MKNKKIILGLGTISALGAMSMAFVACGVKKEVTDNLEKELKKLKDENNIFRKAIGEEKVFETEVEEFFKKTGTGESQKDPKAVGELKKDAKVSDLIAKVKKISGFSDKFDIISKNEDKEGTTDDGKALIGTSHILTIMKKGEIKDTTKLKKEVTFAFTLKTS